MLASSEMTETIKVDQPPVLKLTPIGTEEKINRKAIETEVVQSVRNGKIEFLRIVLESGDDEHKILHTEREVYQADLKLCLAHLERQFFNDQENALNEYVDNISNGENIALLKSGFHDRLKALNGSVIEKAIKLTIDSISQLRNKLKMLNIEVPNIYTLQAHYYNHFKQYEIAIPIKSVSTLQKKIILDISNISLLIENLDQNYHDLLDKMKLLHDSYEQFIADKKAYFINILATDIRKIPFIFNFNPSDKKRIDEFLLLKVSPNLVETVTGDTLLHIAIDHDRENIVNLLLERGADLFIKNKAGVSANDKASSLSNPKYLKIFSLHRKKTQMSEREQTTFPKEILEIIDPIMNEASVILDKYCIKLEHRKNLCLFLQIMLHYDLRIQSRSQDYAVYAEKLRAASKDGDPNIFFNEVLKRAPNAPRGAFNLSSLHDPLYELLLKFMKVFDTQSYNELKKQVKISELPYMEKNPTDEDLIRKLTSDLKSAHNEIELLKAKLKKAEGKSNEPEKGKSHSMVRTVFC